MASLTAKTVHPAKTAARVRRAGTVRTVRPDEMEATVRLAKMV